MATGSRDCTSSAEAGKRGPSPRFPVVALTHSTPSRSAWSTSDLKERDSMVQDKKRELRRTWLPLPAGATRKGVDSMDSLQLEVPK